MNYDFTEKEFAFIAEVQNRLQKVVEATDLEAGDTRRNVCSVLEQLAQTPYLRVGLSEAAPDGIGLVSWMGAMEVIGAVAPSMLLSIEWSTRVFGRIIAGYGNEAIKKKTLSALGRGQIIGAVALSEESLNIENEPLKTEGRQDGDMVVINGAKQYVINAPVADRIAVAGMLAGRPAVFVVDRGTEGLTVEEPMSLIGYDGAAVAGIRMENCRVPSAAVIGPMDSDDIFFAIRGWENQVILGAGLGIMKAAYEAARDYAKKHRSGGKPVIAYQEVGFKLAQMLTMLQAAELLAYRAVWTAISEPKEADSLTLCAKVFATESAEKVAGAALQIMSGAGYQSGNAAERSYRCAKYLQIAGTSTEISRVRIGDDILKY